MAMQAEKTPPTPKVVASAFLEQYYNVLAESPDLVYRFYQENSVVTRPSSEGVMSSTSTLDGISKMILSSDSKNCVVQILSADSQDSLGNGVIVLVTGFVTGKNNIRKKFTQLFFLVPQSENSHELVHYFVLNDLLKYEGEEAVDVDGTVFAVPVLPDPEPEPVTDQPKVDEDTTVSEEDNTQPKESVQSLENGTVSTDDKVIATDHLVDTTQNVNDNAVSDNAPEEAAAAAYNIQDDAPKRSYASVANALNLKQEPFQQRPSPAKPVQQSRPTVATASSARPTPSPHLPASQNPTSNNSVEKNNNFGVRGHSIFVANLPMDATEEQLKEAFEKFGHIKPGGIQVRSYMRDKNCFGFVEFESVDSMNNAVQAATIWIGGREAHIEEKKANNAGSKYPRKGGYRNDNYRGNRNFYGSRNYGRNESENQGGASDKAQNENGGRNGIFNHKVHQNGGVRDASQPQVGKH